MSERTLVSVEPGLGEAINVKLLKAPADLADALVPCPLECSADAMPDWASDAAVRHHGEKIVAALRQHPAVDQALQRALMAPAGETHSIYFQLMVPEVERLCWEGLYDGNRRFLALDRRLAIARVAHSVVDRQLPTRAFEAPIRLLAVLSALGVDARPEWQRLRAAAEHARQAGLEVELRVLSGQRDLVEEIRGAGLDWVEAGPTPQRTSELEEVATEFAPHVLHFFCHGNASHGVSWLEIGTVLDFDSGEAIASFRLDTEELVALPKIDQSWLVVLNCCLGGQASEDSHSMAHELVAKGVPAAIGMLERIEVADAHEFSGALLDAFLARVRELVGSLADGDEAPLEWAELLFGPRRELSERHQDDPENHREWLLPVLYVRPETFVVRRLPAGVSDDAMAAMRNRIDMVAGLLRSLGDETSEEKRREILDLLADVPPAMRPDLFGGFDDA